MADLDVSDSNAVTGTDDLVAEFLAREQSVLGEIDDDFNVETTAPAAATTTDGAFDSNDISTCFLLSKFKRKKFNFNF